MQAYLHFGSAPGPFQTISVKVRETEPRNGSRFMVLWAGKWRRVRRDRSRGFAGAMYIGKRNNWLAAVQIA